MPQSIDPSSKTDAPKVVDYAHAQPSEFSRWLRRLVTVDNLLATMKTLAWVAPLTILIWVYAEREQVATRRVTIPISVHSSDPTRVARLQMSGQGVVADLIGPRAQVDQVFEQITRPGDDPGVHIEIDRTYTPGEQHTLTVAQILSDSPIFKQHGVIVQDPNPSRVLIFVDDLIERDVEVRVPPDVTNLGTTTTFEPAKVRVRGPRQKLTDPSNGRLQVIADLAGRDELRTPGQHEIAAVPLRCSVDDPAVSILPTTVKAILEVNQSNVSYQIPSMPVWPTTPPGLTDKYRIEFTEVLTNITVTGPPDKIDALRKETFKPKARLEVTTADQNKPTQRRKVKFDLPDGVTVSKEDQEKDIPFRLIDRGTPNE